MSDHSCKVDDAISVYGLHPPGSDTTTMDDYLVARWTGSGKFEEIGYKQLTQWFNEYLLTTVYESNGRSTVGNRVEGDREILLGDDDLLREELIDDLDADGIDGGQLQSDLVSWSTMRRHLKRCLSVDKEWQPATTEWEADSVEIASNSLKEKVRKASRSLDSKGEIPGGTAADVDVEIFLSCPQCNRRVPFSVAQRQGYICETHLGTHGTSDPSKVGGS